MDKEARLIAYLRLRLRNEPERTLTLTDGQSLQVGRGLDNDLVLRDSTVSRVHAVFNATLSGVTVNDMFSRNGTFVNGERISSMRHLSAGDVVDVGPGKFVMELPKMSQMAASSRPPSTPDTTDILKPIPLTVLLASFSDAGPNEGALRKLDSAQIESLTQDWLIKVQSIIAKNGGKLDKIVGVNILAHWAAPDEQASAISACRTAVAIRLSFPEFLKEQQRKLSFDSPLRASLILSSGKGMRRAGDNASSGVDDDYIVLGQPAKIAFAMQEVIGPFGYDLVMPESTFNLVYQRITAKKVFSVRLRGQTETMSAYTIEPDAKT